MGFFAKIKAGLTRTKENIGHSIDQLFAGELNDDFYDELEETLILGDMGVLLLFTVAIFAVALVVGRIRVQSAEAGGNAAAATGRA